MEQVIITVFGVSILLGNIDYLADKHYFAEHEQTTVCDMYFKKNVGSG